MSDLTDNPIQKEVERVTLQARETKDAFIIRTIKSFCETITETKLDKKTLVRALTNDAGSYGDGHICPRCRVQFPGGPKHIMGRDYIYCWSCGMKIIRRKH